MIYQANKLKTGKNSSGFTLLELIITCILVGILSSISIVNFSLTMNKERLKSSARSIENWINLQRALAMQNGLTCEIQINENTTQLTSQIASVVPPQSCDVSLGSPSVFNVSDIFNNQKNPLSISLQQLKSDPNKPAGFRFSFRGFSENFNLSGNTTLEIRIDHQDIKSQRCIKVVSPIGLIRDGYTTDSSSPCFYNKPY